MKTRFLLFSALLVSALMGCSKESNEMIDEAVNPKDANFSIIVKGEDTKTTNSGMSTLWASGDDINLFHALTGTSTYVSDGKFVTTGSGASARFTGTVTGELSGNYDWYAIYPYSKFIADGTPANTDPGYITIGTTKTGIQTQSGNNSSAHICGKNYPAAGKVTNIPAAETPSITMKHLSSLLKVMVKNGTTEPIAVRQIQFTSDGEAIVGNYFVDFHGTNPSFTAVDEKTNTTAVLKVTDGEAIAAGSSAAFYLAIKPYTEADGNELKLKVSTYTAEQEKTKAADGDVVFAPGMYKTLNFTFTAVPSVATLPFSIDGTAGKAGYDGVDGLTADNITASDYGSAHSPYLAKWDKDGSYLQLHYDVPAGKVSFGVKMAGGNVTSTMVLKGSVDGISYSDIQTFTIEGAQNTILNFETTNDKVPSTYRYLRLVFNKGSNIGFGPFSVALPSSDPVIMANDIVDIPAIGVADATTTYTVENFSDDVEVSAVDGTIVQSASVTTPGTVTYTVNPNYGYSSRIGTITLNSPSKGINKVINVNQLKSDLKVDNGTTDITVYIPYSSTTATFTVLSKEMGWSTTVTPAAGKNLTISPTSHAADENAQTITVTSTTEATSEPQDLGTIVVYRNGNESDSQKRTITVKKNGASTGVYNKVTTFTAGDYLIVEVPANKVLTGAVSSKTLQTADVTISDNKITGNSTIDSYVITFEALTGDDAGYFALKNGTSYIGYGNSGTDIASSSTIASDKYKWSVSMVGNYVYVVNKGDNTRYLAFNGTAGFKAYKTSNVSDSNDASGAAGARPSLFKK